MTSNHSLINTINRHRNLIIVAVSLLIIIAVGTFFFVQSSNQNIVNNPVDGSGQSSLSPNDAKNLNPPTSSRVISDLAGIEITRQLKEANGVYNMGFISSLRLKDVGIAIPVKVTPETEMIDRNRLNPIQSKPLEDIIPTPNNPKIKNQLIFEKYNIKTPIQYSSFTDVFGVNDNGSINFRSDPRQTNFKDETPIQKKLREGIVHLAISPLPGEEGNSYIIGHSSNNSSVKSDYNEIFKPIESKSQIGDEFTIFDDQGRELKFRVFETLAVEDNDAESAYKNFGDRRVVTLQASIVSKRNGKTAPYQRWLTRAELVL